MQILQTCITLIGLHDWRDIIEIIFFSISIYAISGWLRRDTNAQLLIYFYGYATILIISVALQLTTISFIFTVGAPVVAMLCILLHRETLQRNFIMYTSRMSAHQEQKNDWVEVMLRGCLFAINKRKDLTLVIEHTHHITPMLTTDYAINAPLSAELFAIILQSTTYDSSQLVWVTSSGTLKAINATWQLPEQHDWQTPEVKSLPVWQQDALLMTLKTDAIVVHVLPEQRAFDVILTGKIYEKLSATQALNIIKKYNTLTLSSAKGEEAYEVPPTHNRVEQRTP